MLRYQVFSKCIFKPKGHTKYTTHILMLCLNTYFVLVMITAYVQLQYTFLAITGIRLYNGTHKNEGTLQIQVYGFWGTVCHGYWGVEESNVACRHLGYSKALSFRIITHPGST